MKKIVLIILIFAFMICPSFADGTINCDVDGDTAEITVNGTPNTPVSIVISDENRKYYIDQGATDNTGNITFNVILEEGNTYNCSVNINGEVKHQSFLIDDPGTSNPTDEENIAEIYIKGYKGVVLPRTEVEIEKNDTVLSLTIRTLEDYDIDYKVKDGYISSINGQAEYDKGAKSGWIFKYNGKFSGDATDEVDVEDGDEIQWLYTTDYGKDVGNDWSEKEEFFEEDDIKDIVKDALYNKENSVELKFDNTDENEVLINLSSKVHEEVFDNGIDKLSIKTNLAVIDVTPNTFSESIKGKQLGIEVKKIKELPNSSVLESLIPEDSTIVDINIFIENEKISQFKEPIDIRIPYLGDAKAGDRITVFLLKDDGAIEPMGGIYDLTTKTVKFSTNHLSKYFAKPAVKEFVDMNGYQWAKDAVEIMAGKNFLKGRAEKFYDPNNDITRAEFVSIITRMFKYRASTNLQMNFKDVNTQAWYYDAVAAAYENGLINGKSEIIFDPNGKITRQEAAKIIAEVLNKKSYESKETSISDFKDINKIAFWAKDSVTLSSKLGIINGMDNGEFAPDKDTNRAEAAVMLYRMYKVIMR